MRTIIEYEIGAAGNRHTTTFELVGYADVYADFDDGLVRIRVNDEDVLIVPKERFVSARFERSQAPAAGAEKLYQQGMDY